MKANLKMIREKGRGSFFGVMGKSIKGNGKMGNKMESGIMLMKKGRRGRGYGRMERKLSGWIEE